MLQGLLNQVKNELKCQREEGESKAGPLRPIQQRFRQLEFSPLTPNTLSCGSVWPHSASTSTGGPRLLLKRTSERRGQTFQPNPQCKKHCSAFLVSPRGLGYPPRAGSTPVPRPSLPSSPLSALSPLCIYNSYVKQVSEAATNPGSLQVKISGRPNQTSSTELTPLPLPNGPSQKFGCGHLARGPLLLFSSPKIKSAPFPIPGVGAGDELWAQYSLGDCAPSHMGRA